MYLILYIQLKMHIMSNKFPVSDDMPSRIDRLNSDELFERVDALAAQIRARRKAMGVSATAAAEAAGMSRVTWHRIEQGQTSVTIGAWFNALAVLGLKFGLGESSPDSEVIGRDGNRGTAGLLPVRIQLSEYPQLQALAWQIPGTEEVTPQEALDIYSRNRRHIDAGAIAPRERALIDALQRVFGDRGLGA